MANAAQMRGPWAQETAVREYTVAVPNELYEKWRPPRLYVELPDGVAVRYLPTSILEDRRIRPDRWIPPHMSTAPGRSAICITWGGELVEQDDDGRIWINARAGSPEWLLDFGVPGPSGERQIAVGKELALLAGGCMRDGYVLRIAVSQPLLWVYRTPAATGHGFPGWLEMARSHVEGLECEDGGSPGSGRAAGANVDRLPDLRSGLGSSRKTGSFESDGASDD